MKHTPTVSAIHPAKALLCVGRILYRAPMPLTDTAIRSDQKKSSRTNPENAGPLQVGEDLMVIDVGATIGVRKPARSSP